MPRSRARANLIWAFFLIVAASGCDACDGALSEDEERADYVTLAPEVDGLLGALCDYYERCPSEFYAVGYRDREECVQIHYFILTCRLLFEEDAVGNDVVRLERRELPQDAAGLNACRDWIAGASCEDWESANAGPCTVLAQLFVVDDDEEDDGGGDDDVYVFDPDEGERCDSTYSCLEGLRCLDLNSYEGYPSSETDYCPICVAPSQEGENCTEPMRHCQYDDEVRLYCSEATGLCVGPLAAGSPCAETVVPCDEGSYCDDETGLCTARLAAGEPCVSWPPRCAPGLHCSVGLDVCSEPEADGATCNNDDHCASGFCNSRPSTGYCDSAGFEGDPCINERDCREGDCVPDVLICVTPRPDDAPCVRDWQCRNAYCDPETGRCGGRDNGAACTEDNNCRSGSCDPLAQLCGRPDGEPCSEDLECRSNSCDPGSGSCETLAALGAGCYADDDCSSGLCDQSLCRVRCDSASDCADGELCFWSSNACRPIGEDGAECDRDEDCLSGWCSLTGKCGHPPQVGDPCAEPLDCYPRGYCADGVCRAKLGPGESCSGYDACLQPYACLDGRCTRFSLECRPAPVGETCALFTVCEDGAYCDPLSELTCKPRKAEGSDCWYDTQCQEGLLCEGSCIRAPEEGEACASSEGCAPGLWCDSDSDPSICRALLVDGEPCVYGEQCASGQCYNNTCGDGSSSACVLP